MHHNVDADAIQHTPLVIEPSATTTHDLGVIAHRLHHHRRHDHGAISEPAAAPGPNIAAQDRTAFQGPVHAVADASAATATAATT